MDRDGGARMHTVEVSFSLSSDEQEAKAQFRDARLLLRALMQDSAPLVPEQAHMPLPGKRYLLRASPRKIHAILRRYKRSDVGEETPIRDVTAYETTRARTNTTPPAPKRRATATRRPATRKKNRESAASGGRSYTSAQGLEARTTMPHRHTTNSLGEPITQYTPRPERDETLEARAAEQTLALPDGLAPYTPSIDDLDFRPETARSDEHAPLKRLVALKLAERMLTQRFPDYEFEDLFQPNGGRIAELDATHITGLMPEDLAAYAEQGLLNQVENGTSPAYTQRSLIRLVSQAEMDDRLGLLFPGEDAEEVALHH